LVNANLEMKVLQNLLTNERFTREVVPNLELEYFTGNSKTIFESVVQFVTKYKKLPTLDAFLIDMKNNNKIGDETFNQIATQTPMLFERDEVDYDWLLDATEKWCKDRAVQNALLKSVLISEGKDSEMSRDAIPDILQKALSVSFDKSVGHDYLEDWEKRWDYYNREYNRLKTHLEMLNAITNGGLRSKSLNVIMASTGVGKSTIMGDLAANHLIDGKNVLYISMEMSEEEIGERVDANLMDISTDQIKTLPKDIYSRKAM
jgi:replicative DNA helicase